MSIQAGLKVLVSGKTCQVVDELLRRPAGNAAVADLPGIGFAEQRFFVHDHAGAPGEGADDAVILLPAGGRKIDCQAEAAGQGQLLLHGVGPVDIAVVFHVGAVIPGLPDEMTAVGCSID